MLRYLKYEAKKSLMIFIATLLSGIFLFIPIIFNGMFFDIEVVFSYIGYYMFINIIIFIIYGFSYNKKRRSSDLYYSLPVSHEGILASKLIVYGGELLVTLIALIIEGFIACNILNGKDISGFIYEFKNEDMMRLLYIILIQVATIIPLFSVLLWGYMKANNLSDGIFYMAFLMIIPLLLGNICKYILEVSLDNDTVINGLSLGLFNMLVAYPKYYIYASSGLVYNTYLLLGIIITISSLLLIIPLYLNAKNRYAEEIELSDNSYFGYKILVPVFIILMLSQIIIIFGGDISVKIASYFGAIALEYLLFAYFERGFFLKKGNIIDLIATGVLMLLPVILI